MSGERDSTPARPFAPHQRHAHANANANANANQCQCHCYQAGMSMAKLEEAYGKVLEARFAVVPVEAELGE